MTELDDLAQRVADLLIPRMQAAAAAAVEAQTRQPQWAIMPGVIDPESQRGAICNVEPDDTPGEVVEAVRLDPRQGVPDGAEGERLRTLILRVPPAGAYCLGIIPDDDDSDDPPPTLALPASMSKTDATNLNPTNTTYGAVDNVGVVFFAPGTGRVRVKVGAFLRNSTTSGTFMGAAIRTGDVVGSGTLVQAAADGDAAQMNGDGSNTDGGRVMVEYVIEGLVPGAVYNARMEHRVGAGTGTFERRTIIVSPDMGVATP